MVIYNRHEIPSILSNLQYLLKQTSTKPTTENTRSTLTLFPTLPMMGSYAIWHVSRSGRVGSLHRKMSDTLPRYSLSSMLSLGKHFWGNSANWLSCPATRSGMLDRCRLGAPKTSPSSVRDRSHCHCICCFPWASPHASVSCSLWTS